MFYHVTILAFLDERMPLVQGYTHHSDTQCNEKTFLFLKKKRAIMICKKGRANICPGYNKYQSVSCENKFARAHVRARSHMCDVRAKRFLKHACDVRACGRFSSVRRAIAILHILG